MTSSDTVSTCESTAGFPDNSFETSGIRSSSGSVSRELAFHSIKCLITNCRSMLNKLHELEAVIDFYLPDVIGLSETWLTSSVLELLKSFNMFQVFRKDRSVGRGGGTCLLINKHLNVKPVSVHIPDKYSSLEILVVDLILNKCRTRLIIVYRPQRSNDDEADLDTILLTNF